MRRKTDNVKQLLRTILKFCASDPEFKLKCKCRNDFHCRNTDSECYKCKRFM